MTADELRQEIEQTREQLGETVEQLVAKADIKGRAQAKVSDLSQKAKSAGTAVTEQLPGQVAAASAPAWKATPEPARQAVTKAAGQVRQRPVPLAAAAAVLLAGYLIMRRWRKR